MPSYSSLPAIQLAATPARSRNRLVTLSQCHKVSLSVSHKVKYEHKINIKKKFSQVDNIKFMQNNVTEVAILCGIQLFFQKTEIFFIFTFSPKVKSGD